MGGLIEKSAQGVEDGTHRSSLLSLASNLTHASRSAQQASSNDDASWSSALWGERPAIVVSLGGGWEIAKCCAKGYLNEQGECADVPGRSWSWLPGNAEFFVDGDLWGFSLVFPCKSTHHVHKIRELALT